MWLDQISSRQDVEMKRERRPRQPEAASNCSSLQTIWRVSHKQAEDVQPRPLGQR